jgi:hypothetical protein
VDCRYHFLCFATAVIQFAHSTSFLADVKVTDCSGSSGSSL